MKFILIRSILTIMSYLPLSIIRLIGSFIGAVAIAFSKNTSKRLRSNLMAAKMCNENNLESMARSAASEWGKTIVETFCLWHRSLSYNAKLVVKAKNYELVESSVLGNSPVIFLTPHLGNFEVALKYTASKLSYYKFTVLYKPSKIKWLNQIMVNGRAETNIEPVTTSKSGVMALLKGLRANGIVGILPDSVASHKDSGVWVDFFGKKVFATTLAAKLLLMPNIVSFIVASYRVKGGFEVEYIPFTPKHNDVVAVVQEIYKAIEEMVLKSPSQYYWSYDRFRVPKYAMDK